MSWEYNISPKIEGLGKRTIHTTKEMFSIRNCDHLRAETIMKPMKLICAVNKKLLPILTAYYLNICCQ